MLGQIGYFFNIIFTFPILNGLLLLDHVIGDFGLSIIVLTVLIRLLLFPLTLKQLKSTKAMQAVQPLIADVKKQYPKDQRAQLEATQAIYKEYGVNPAAGCLPLFIQLPVIYGLFNSLETVLRNSSVTVHSINSIIYPFLPHITQLPNANLDWFTFINHSWFINLGASDPTHILPILAAIATFVQLRMSQPRTTVATKSAMSSQMQIMQFIMPFVTLFFAWTFPAGLALYWTTTSIFSMVQQYFVTGWGSLFIKPSFTLPGSNNSSSNDKGKSYTGDRRKETRVIEQGKASDNAKASTDGPVGSKLSTHANGSNGNGASGASSVRRRARPGSASARRRNNVPRRNPSRS
ncbi:MAG: YidC/Oxa1 family membrane protein insertase [Ktedonobacteraceae bacterium]